MGADRTTADFKVAYSGSGTHSTKYHSEPPNSGGQHDTNDATDSSSQHWSLRFNTLTIPRCGAAGGRSDPCLLVSPRAATGGTERVTGRIAHAHVDGLFPVLNASVACGVHFATAPAQPLSAMVDVRHYSHSGLIDYYFTPGFSFAPIYQSAGPRATWSRKT